MVLHAGHQHWLQITPAVNCSRYISWVGDMMQVTNLDHDSMNCMNYPFSSGVTRSPVACRTGEPSSSCWKSRVHCGSTHFWTWWSQSVVGQTTRSEILFWSPEGRKPSLRRVLGKRSVWAGAKSLLKGHPSVKLEKSVHKMSWRQFHGWLNCWLGWRNLKILPSFYYRVHFRVQKTLATHVEHHEWSKHMDPRKTWRTSPSQCLVSSVTQSHLLGGWPTPLKNMSQFKSVGMMTFPRYGKIIHSCSSHHQPVIRFHLRLS